MANAHNPLSKMTTAICGSFFVRGYELNNVYNEGFGNG